MKILKGIPKTLLSACHKANQRMPGCVSGVYVLHSRGAQAGAPEYLVELSRGFCNPSEDVHAIRHSNAKDAISKVRQIAVCKCRECRDVKK